MTKETLSAQEQEENDVLDKINAKVNFYIEALRKDMQANQLSISDTGVYTHNGAWVVKEHHYTPQNFDFTIQ